MAKKNEKMFFMFSNEENEKMIKAVNHFNSSNGKMMSRQKFLLHLANEYCLTNKLI